MLPFWDDGGGRMGNRIVLLKGSPRKNGNTNAITEPVIAALKEGGCSVEVFDLYGMEILPCIACRECQRDWTRVNCAREDDMGRIFGEVSASDMIILSTPVYSWYCTPPMKAALDRMVYAMNMYYGESRGPSLWEGKSLALITTCGYPPEKGADLFEEGMKRYCRHSKLLYRGMLCGHHLGYGTQFMDDEKERRARAFAARLLMDEGGGSL